MLYSQGIALETLGVRKSGGLTPNLLTSNLRESWQVFADNFHLFRGTPTGIWLTDEFANVFGVTEKLTGDNAQEIYDQIDVKLKSPDFKPRALYEKFNIEVLCTMDAATDSLEYHQRIRESGCKWFCCR